MKTIFIGSSSEALPIVEKVKALLEDSYKIIQWNESFTPNKSTLDCLIENAIKIDEAIFIGAIDDKTSAIDTTRLDREGVLHKTRDNVIFEFGLFLGMLGRKDCIFLADNQMNIMSDYKGITTILFDQNNLDDSLSQAVNSIKKYFEEYSNRDINLFPSTFLASAYFVNFIKPIFDHYLEKGNKIITDKKSYTQCEITIILPTKITDNLNAQVEILKQNINTRQERIEYLGRSRQLLVDVSSSGKCLKIIDFPTILVSLNHAVHALLPDEVNKQRPCYDDILDREVNRFIESLKLYTNEASCPIKINIKKEDVSERKTPLKKRGILKYFFLDRN